MLNAIGKEPSELGREIAVDLKADADFYEHRCGPGHDHFLLRRALAANGTWIGRPHFERAGVNWVRRVAWPVAPPPCTRLRCPADRGLAPDSARCLPHSYRRAEPMRQALLDFGRLRSSPPWGGADQGSRAPSGPGWPGSWPPSVDVGRPHPLSLAALQLVGPRFDCGRLRQTLPDPESLGSWRRSAGAGLTGAAPIESHPMLRRLGQSLRPWRRGSWRDLRFQSCKGRSLRNSRPMRIALRWPG
jgi:hypothetical protein